jgi:hypothetical protein
MERGASPVLTAQAGQSRGAEATAARASVPRPRAGGARRPRRSRLRATLAGFGDSCALVGVALLGCLAVVAVGTIGSLFWTFVIER